MTDVELDERVTDLEENGGNNENGKGKIYMSTCLILNSFSCSFGSPTPHLLTMRKLDSQ